MAKSSSKLSKESAKVKMKTATCPKRNNGIEDYACDMYGSLGNAILESEGPSNMNQKNSAIKHVDFFSKPC